MPEGVSPARALVRHVTSTTIAPHVDLQAMGSVENGRETGALSDIGIPGLAGTGSGVDGREPRDRVSAGTPRTPPSICRLDVAGSIDHHPSPPLHVQLPVSSPDLSIAYVSTHERLIPDEVIRWIEGIVTDRYEDGAELIGRLPRDAAQALADAVDKVRLHTSSLQRHAV